MPLRNPIGDYPGPLRRLPKLGCRIHLATLVGTGGKDPQ